MCLGEAQATHESEKMSPPGGREKSSELTTGVDDAEVFPRASVTWISEVSGGGSDLTARLALTAGGEDLERNVRLAVWWTRQEEDSQSTKSF